jgi:hypothetical protein
VGRSKIKQLIGDHKAKKFEALYAATSFTTAADAGLGRRRADAALEIGFAALLADIMQSARTTVCGGVEAHRVVWAR